MRSFIRHPSDMPIEILNGAEASASEALRDISRGGLSFRYPRPVNTGEIIRVRIAVIEPVFEADCRVAWCLAEGDVYQVGVEFLVQEDLYRARMIEQICQIEGYRRDVRDREGRALSSQEAASEWITKFARRFPSFGV